MLPINNSDTAWLIVSDYNQENDKHYEDLREDILNPEIHQWHWEGNIINQGVGVPLEFTIYGLVGQHYVGGFGSAGDFIGGMACPIAVGGISSVGGVSVGLVRWEELDDPN